MWEKFSALIESSIFQFILPLVLTFVITLVGLRLVNIASDAIEKRLITKEQEADRQQRLRTLISTAKITARTTVLALATLSVLTICGIDIGPLIAAAGIVGLAISLGAQTLIKDFFGGTMILIEDQFRVGDWIQVADVEGTVEKVTLRRTNVRAGDGTLFIVPNGDVRVVGNATRDWSRAVVEINLPFDADISQAISVCSKAMAEVANDPEVADALLESPEVLGWNQANDWSLRLRMQAKVKPGQHWRVARVMRRIALQALRDAGMAVARPLDSSSPAAPATAAVAATGPVSN